MLLKRKALFWPSFHSVRGWGANKYTKFPSPGKVLPELGVESDGPVFLIHWQKSLDTSK